MYFVNTSLSIKHLKAAASMKYAVLGQSVVTNLALYFTSYVFATQLSPKAVYFMQTGRSALSSIHTWMY